MASISKRTEVNKRRTLPRFSKESTGINKVGVSNSGPYKGATYLEKNRSSQNSGGGRKAIEAKLKTITTSNQNSAKQIAKIKNPKAFDDVRKNAMETMATKMRGSSTGGMRVALAKKKLEEMLKKKKAEMA